MSKPNKPTPPTAPSRTRPADFSDESEAFLGFIAGGLLDYLDQAGTFILGQAGSVLAAAAVKGLTSAFLSANAGKAIGINSAGNALEGKDTVNLTFANQTEAEGGTNNTKAMSPLRTKQAIDAFAPGASGRKKIKTLTANSSASLAFSGTDFDSTQYTDYEFVIDNLLPATGAAELELRSSDDGGATQTQKRTVGGSWSTNPIDLGDNVGTATDETGLSGALTIFDFHADKGAMFLFDGVQVNHLGTVSARDLGGLLQRPSVDAPLNHVGFQASSGNLASGSITLYGILS